MSEIVESAIGKQWDAYDELREIAAALQGNAEYYLKQLGNPSDLEHGTWLVSIARRVDRAQRLLKLQERLKFGPSREYANWLEQQIELWKRVMSKEAELHNTNAWERASARVTAYKDSLEMFNRKTDNEWDILPGAGASTVESAIARREKQKRREELFKLFSFGNCDAEIIAQVENMFEREFVSAQSIASTVGAMLYRAAVTGEHTGTFGDNKQVEKAMQAILALHGKAK
jgi:hypothetical protein